MNRMYGVQNRRTSKEVLLLVEIPILITDFISEAVGKTADVLSELEK